MKRFVLILTVLCLAGFSAVQAQVIADFEVAGLGTAGFADNGWGTALTGGVARIADPTGVSGFVLGLNYNGTRGVIQKDSYSPKNGHVISFQFYLPADFPDDATIYFWGQDRTHWSHTTETFTGADIPKGKWVALNFHIAGLNLAHPTTFTPYTALLNFGVDINTTATYTGQILIDDVTLLGDTPKVQADFEATGLNGWGDSGWSNGFSHVTLVVDPNDATNHVMEVGQDATKGPQGQLSSGQINLTKLDQVMAFQIWIPLDYPDTDSIQIVGQDRTHWADGGIQKYSGADLVKGQWNEIYLDILRYYQTDSSKFTPYSSGGFGRVWIGFYNNTTFTGSVYMDNITLLEPAPPPTAEIVSPQITVTAGIDSIADPFTGEIFYHNNIAWIDLTADMGETYSLYYSESAKITDVTAPGIIQITKHIGRGVQIWHHRMYTLDGAEKTVYYAMTVTALDGGAVVEKPIRDGISNSGAVKAKTSLLYEIPLIKDFPFAADAYLDEFEALTSTFTRLPLRNQQSAGDADQVAAWTTTSADLQLKGYVVTDGDNLYIGMDVTDDLPHGDGQAWAGDGFDFFSSLYDVRTLTSLWRGDDEQGGAVTDPNTGGAYRLSLAIGASQGDHWGYGGGNTWAGPAGAEYAQDIFDGGYIVELKIPYATLDTKFNGGSFKPEEGMLLCGKIDLNDNDTETASNTRSLQNHWGDVPGNNNSWMRAEAWATPFVVTSTHIVKDWTAVDTKEANAPNTFALSRNYPNPFNPSTTMNYQLSHASDVSIVVYDLLGKEIRTLVEGKMQAGTYTVSWDGTNNAGLHVSSGMYFCKMVSSGFTKIQKMTLLK
jgi:hypothetical protein